jgi:cytochrome c oxidase subunit 2
VNLLAFQLPFFPEQASSFAKDVDLLTVFLILMSTFFSVLIAGMVLYFAVKYRRRHEDEVGTEFHESPLLEITWTVIPLIIVLVTFGWGAKVFFRLYRPPAGAAEYQVTGKQWMWKLQHPTGQREINALHLPVGQPVKLTMTSEDVIHSLFVPAFRAKMDVVPGRYTTMWFTPTKPGIYHLFCTEYCGVEHSRMIGSVTVLEREAFQGWLASVPVPATPEQRGQELFARHSCASCHDGSDGAGARAPSLHGLFGKKVVLASGERVEADENYLRESILDPAAHVAAGWQPTMPTYRGQLDEEGVMHLIRFLKSLPAERAAGLPAQPAAPTARASEGVVR